MFTSFDDRMLAEIDFQDWFDELTPEEKAAYWAHQEAQQKADMAAWEEAWAVMSIEAVENREEAA